MKNGQRRVLHTYRISCYWIRSEYERRDIAKTETDKTVNRIQTEHDRYVFKSYYKNNATRDCGEAKRQTPVWKRDLRDFLNQRTSLVTKEQTSLGLVILRFYFDIYTNDYSCNIVMICFIISHNLWFFVIWNFIVYRYSVFVTYAARNG